MWIRGQRTVWWHEVLSSNPNIIIKRKAPGGEKIAHWVLTRVLTRFRTRVQIPRTHLKIDMVGCVYYPSAPMKTREAETGDSLKALGG